MATIGNLTTGNLTNDPVNNPVTSNLTSNTASNLTSDTETTTKEEDTEFFVKSVIDSIVNKPTTVAEAITILSFIRINTIDSLVDTITEQVILLLPLDQQPLMRASLNVVDGIVIAKTVAEVSCSWCFPKKQVKPTN